MGSAHTAHKVIHLRSQLGETGGSPISTVGIRERRLAARTEARLVNGSYSALRMGSALGGSGGLRSLCLVILADIRGSLIIGVRLVQVLVVGKGHVARLPALNLGQGHKLLLVHAVVVFNHD